MTTYFAVQYGSYIYSATPSKPSALKDAIPAVLRTSKPSSVDGEYTAGGKVSARRPVLTGWVIASSPDDGGESMRSALDSFRCAHSPGAPREFFIDSDRYLNAEIESIDIAEWKGMPNAQFTANLYCADPFWYSSAAPTSVDLSLGSNTVTTAGTWTALPKITVQITSFTAGATITITNSTTGESITLTPVMDETTETPSVPTLVIDSFAENITAQADGSDMMATFTAGVFISLAGGNLLSDQTNTIVIQTTGTIVLGQITIAWQDRWI